MDHVLASCKRFRTGARLVVRRHPRGTMVSWIYLSPPKSSSALSLAVDTNILIRRNLNRATVELFRLHETGKVNLEKTDTLDAERLRTACDDAEARLRLLESMDLVEVLGPAAASPIPLNPRTSDTANSRTVRLIDRPCASSTRPRRREQRYPRGWCVATVCVPPDPTGGLQNRVGHDRRVVLDGTRKCAPT